MSKAKRWVHHDGMVWASLDRLLNAIQVEKGKELKVVQELSMKAYFVSQEYIVEAQVDDLMRLALGRYFNLRMSDKELKRVKRRLQPLCDRINGILKRFNRPGGQEEFIPDAEIMAAVLRKANREKAKAEKDKRE